MENIVLAIAREVEFGALTLQEAIDAVTADHLLSLLPDDELAELLDEAVQGPARDGRFAARDAAAYDYMHHLLGVECAKARLSQITQLRAADPGERSGRRLADWTSRTAGYAFQLGMRSVVSANLPSAFELLVQAEELARRSTGLGRPRFTEMVAALVGQIQVAQLAGQHRAVADAKHRLLMLAAAPEWQPRAEAEIRSLTQDFAKLAEVRLTLENAPSGSPVNGAPPAHRSAGPGEPAGSASADAKLGSYLVTLHRAAREAAAGHISLDEAAGRLVATAPPGRLPVTSFRPLYMHLTHLAELAPDQGVVVARLHSRAVAAVAEPPAALPIGLAALTLGTALVHSQEKKPPAARSPDALGEAVAALKECLPVLDSHGAAEHAAKAAMLLGRTYSLAGDVTRSAAASRDAVRRLEALPASSPQQRVNLAAAQGNLASALERTGFRGQALDLYQRAYREFIALRDVPLSLVALSDLSRVADEIGRGDEAAAAAFQAMVLLEQAADPIGAAEGCVKIARSAMRNGRDHIAVEALRRADRLVTQVPFGQEGRSPEWFRLVSDIRLCEATMILRAMGPGDSGGRAPMIRALAQEARDTAKLAGSDVTRAGAMLLQAKAELLAGQPDHARELLAELERDGVPAAVEADLAVLRASPELATDPALLAPTLARAANSYEAADQPHRALFVLVHLGELYERASDDERALAAYERADSLADLLRGRLAADTTRIGLRGNLDELYLRLILLHARRTNPADPGKVWYWIERAKARALAELMSLGPITPDRHVDRPEVRRLLAEEAELLPVLRRARLEDDIPLSEAVPDTEAPHRPREAVQAFTRLQEVWRELSPDLPGYVALRTANVADWAMVQRRLSDPGS